VNRPTMRAVVVTPKQPHSTRLIERPIPERGPDEYFIRCLEVGIDGTDQEIVAGLYGEAPHGEDVLILCHESLGEVVEGCSSDEIFCVGDLVVPTVRRPDPERCLNCRVGEFDFCLNGKYRERGIKQLHGYLSDYYAERAEYLIRIPAESRRIAVLLEPLAVVEKAYRQVSEIQRRMRWQPARVVVVGAGSIGMLAMMIGLLRGLEVVVYSRHDPQGTRAEILRNTGATYVNSDKQTMEDMAKELGAPDILFEATGHSPFAWQGAGILRTNGIACLLSVTGGDREAVIPSDRLNANLVLGNRLIFGSVNQHRIDFEQALVDLTAAEQRWPGLTAKYITRTFPLEQFRDALAPRERGDLKTVVRVAT